MALTPAKLSRLRGLVALSGSPNEHEASVAAMTACRIMREERIDPAEVIALLPAPAGARPYVAPPPPPAAPPPEWTVPRQLSSADLDEHARMLTAQAFVRASEAAAARVRLERAQRDAAQREADLQDQIEQQARELDRMRQMRRTAAVMGAPPRRPLGPPGAGRREPW